jgi:hypothetical protein
LELDPVQCLLIKGLKRLRSLKARIYEGANFNFLVFIKTKSMQDMPEIYQNNKKLRIKNRGCQTKNVILPT